MLRGAGSVRGSVVSVGPAPCFRGFRGRNAAQQGGWECGSEAGDRSSLPAAGGARCGSCPRAGGFPTGQVWRRTRGGLNTVLFCGFARFSWCLLIIQARVYCSAMKTVKDKHCK